MFDILSGVSDTVRYCPILSGAVRSVSGVSGVSDVKLDMDTHDHVRNVSGPVRNVSGPVRNVSGDAVRSCPKRVSGMSGNVR